MAIRRFWNIVAKWRNLTLSRDKAVYRVALCVNNITKIRNIYSGGIFFIAQFRLHAADIRR